jgi:alpha/beta superfamily hydrolase
MSKNLNSAVGVFGDPEDTESAVEELKKSGYDMKKCSIVGGLLVGWIVSSLAMNGPLSNFGIPKVSIHQYENALRADKTLLVVQGTLPEVEKATNILMDNKAEYANYHKIEIDKPLALSY